MTKANANGAAKLNRPERSEEELQRMRAANERRERRHDPITASVKREVDGRLALDVPHDDHRGWLIRLGDAVGSRSDKFAMEGTVRNSVCGRRIEHQAAMARVKRSPNMTANCALAMTHSRGPIFHAFSERFKTR